ncbi:MAG TPA: Rieske (2Fe-2S) protein [Gemmatimonadales bacterium]|nr:Rieske (2Fe-2S) protein [Gemmatimonadales bacterium]
MASSSDPQFSDSEPPPATPRRRFLRWLSGLGAVLSGGLIGIPSLRAFFWPTHVAPSKEHWVKVVDDVALVDIGAPMRVDFVELASDAWVETRVLNSVWIYTEDGEHFKAYNGHCTHLGCGYIYDKDKKHFACPCHHGVFDVKSGAVLGGPPPRPLDELRVEVRDAEIHVNYQDFRLGIAERLES